MKIEYHIATSELSHHNRIVVDYDAILDPTTTVMFCKINEGQFRTLIFQNNGIIIKTPLTPKTLIKNLLAPQIDLADYLIDGVLYYEYNVISPQTRQLPIMGSDFLIAPIGGTSRKRGGWVFLNRYSTRKAGKNHFVIDIPQYDYEIHLHVSEKAFQSNRKFAYCCYGFAKEILPKYFQAELPTTYKQTVTHSDLAKFFYGMSTLFAVKLLKNKCEMSYKEIDRLINEKS